ncbi:Hint domain-containing protein [Gemmobacter sp. 24YEA27]|uniref:Hint domain-containing protein n=1 Tax=Gemmobacter sp. 24YEA27 TaxID=3040672 RepID=UPI0024B3C1C6|nr:Hint domain-containing protein [Gemmobacter sp. 24YEA27]
MTTLPDQSPGQSPGQEHHTASAATAGGAAPGQACQVFAAGDIFVSSGVNSGDGLGLPDDVESGDIYQLELGAAPSRLLLEAAGDCGAQRVAAGSAVGQAGDLVRLIARYTLMADDGDRVELLLIRIGEDGADALWVLPLSPVSDRAEYALLAVEISPRDARLTAMMSLSFARGTRISLASGQMVAIETLRPGMKLLTRDHGPQELRHIGRASLRAIGAFAPVVILAGTLGNSGDLIVGQHHRMFLYQRHKLPGLATSELLVQARHLVDEEHVFIRESGVTDWFSLIFDRHEIIYAEGIPVESLMVNDATISRLPPQFASEVRAQFPGLAHLQHFGTEAGRQFLDSIGGPAHWHSRGAGGNRNPAQGVAGQSTGQSSGQNNKPG